MTPHERRVRELEAIRGVRGALESLVSSSTGTVATAAVADAFEQNSSRLPDNSEVLATFNGMASKLRAEKSGRLAEGGVRRIAMRMRQREDDLARWVDARGARLSEKGGGGGS